MLGTKTNKLFCVHAPELWNLNKTKSSLRGGLPVWKSSSLAGPVSWLTDSSGWWGWRLHAPFIFLLGLAWNSQWFLSKESMFSSPIGPHKLRTVSKRQYTSEKLLKERCPLGQLLADSQSVTFWKTESGKINGCQEVEVHGVIFPEGVS